MMYIRTETYRPLYFGKTLEINCKSCGKKLTRKFKDFYTRNPFNTKTDEECRAACYARVDADIAEAKEKGVICRTCKKANEVTP